MVILVCLDIGRRRGVCAWGVKVISEIVGCNKVAKENIVSSNTTWHEVMIFLVSRL